LCFFCFPHCSPFELSLSFISSPLNDFFFSQIEPSSLLISSITQQTHKNPRQISSQDEFTA